MKNNLYFILVLFVYISNLIYPQLTINDPRFDEQWYLYMPGVPESQRADIRAYEAWSVTTGSPSIKIAIIESNSPSNLDGGEPNY